MIVSDARAFQSTLKMQILAPPSSNMNLRVSHTAISKKVALVIHDA